MSTNIDYYINFARFFIHNGMKVIISLPHKIEKAIKLINECNLEKDIYIDTFVPQKYVLDNSPLFLSSGGQNSILESMYFKVPTLITPMTSEQKINGIVLEEKNLSRTTYDIKKSIKQLVV